ncbi:MAG: exosortase/archaeosortase family protein [Verrucomicrobiae bacterium]|nr:exosortase/archaeosortase family protein [Verrucomicrobiae bacterium]
MSSAPAKQKPFTTELREFWDALPDKGLFFALLAAWLALFHLAGNSTFGYWNTPSLLKWLVSAYDFPGFASDDSHGFFMPFVVLALLWWKREELIALPKRTWWPGLLLLAGALLLHLLGYLVQQPRLSIVSLFAGVYCLTGLVWGPRWMAATFFPMVLLSFCLPIASISEPVTFPLRMIVTKLSVGIGHNVLGIDVVRDGSRIFDSARTFQYDVAPACSGIRSLTSLLALTTIYGFVTFRTWWKQLTMVLLAVPLAVAATSPASPA